MATAGPISTSPATPRPSLLFRNNRDGTFTEQGLEAGVSLSEDGQEQAGMGVAIGDFDTDGHLDIFKTHFRADTNVLYRNNGKGYFPRRHHPLRPRRGNPLRRLGRRHRGSRQRRPPRPLLHHRHGLPRSGTEVARRPYKTPSVIFRNLGDGKFEELREQAGPGIAETHSSRGAAFGDFDNDGDIDILIVNLNEPPSLLRNDLAGTDHWLKVQLIGVASNRSAIGAQVVAAYGERRQAQAVLAQSSYLSVNDRRCISDWARPPPPASRSAGRTEPSEKIADVLPVGSSSFVRIRRDPHGSLECRRQPMGGVLWNTRFPATMRRINPRNHHPHKKSREQFAFSGVYYSSGMTESNRPILFVEGTALARRSGITARLARVHPFLYRFAAWRD